MAETPFVDAETSVQQSGDWQTCTKRHIKLTDAKVTYTKKGFCESEEKSQAYANLGTLSAKTACCAYELKITGLGTFRGSSNPMNCGGVFCVTVDQLKKLKTDIEERQNYHQ